ncbi:hypothetical protein MCOR02_004317 [Pyricularia oryzae]|uniref:Protein kinase domain-containing protein n=1 Tax=Pyricularia oryzae TaxID=318829 RepID=A0A4P7N171_PYROR|nr:hypothetical protein MCOR02_004317 [Pyricularia oryzae]KAI6288918.1 hypothetical protein MCOR34_010801 [Pyricularia oryzae]KAI6459050.1 hypothetical protein MCOR17_007140 [Pyricularia oryzae]KAI6478743.1 hypothetical protein MCOR13_011665 [Pyricularia oryzae]KAI6548240.1 hypothetical protein MCOR04_011621 [Pyricularia oryzae]
MEPQNSAIVQLFGIDARVRALYMEDIRAPSFGDEGYWRGPNGYFSGTGANAERIMRDMISALSWVHGLQVTHNDIKPANILFSGTRGAVLIDLMPSMTNN